VILAQLFLIRLTDLPTVAAAGPAGVVTALRQVGHEFEDAYFWPGHDLLFTVQHLWQAKGVSLFSLVHQEEERLLTDERTGVTIIIGPEHKALLPKLNPALHDPQEFVAALVGWGVAAAEATLAAPDALELLYEQISVMPDDCLLVIHVGSV
jgi:hypothetical protein